MLSVRDDIRSCLCLKPFMCPIRPVMIVMVVVTAATPNRYNTDRAGTDNTTINGFVHWWPCNDPNGRAFSYHVCHSWQVNSVVFSW